MGQSRTDKVRRQQREWYLAHRDEILRRRKKHYHANQESELTRQRAWRKANPQKYQQRRRSRYRTRKLRAIELFGGQCQDCGGKFAGRPEVFDFDHRDPSTKLKKPESLLRGPWDVFLAEAQKCDLVCANCHRTRTVRRVDELAAGEGDLRAVRLGV